MNNKNKAMPSIISGNMDIEGTMSSSGVIEIEGITKGKIKGNIVTIRDTGCAEGEIEVDTINICGKFRGDIKAKNVNVSKDANITGVIEYDSLSVEDGASIEGQFKKINQSSS